jgi:hypothetical protein
MSSEFDDERLEDTRERLARDVGALKQKLKPRRLARDTARKAADKGQEAAAMAAERGREAAKVAAAQSARAARDVARTARANPLPFVAVGAAAACAAWALARHRRNRERPRLWADMP